MTRRWLLVVITLAAGCGGDSPAPQPSPTINLPAGRYTFSLVGSSCIMLSMNGGIAPPAVIRVAVDVAPASDWRVRLTDPAAGTLDVTLTRTSGGVNGTITGSVSFAGATATLNHSLNGTQPPSGGLAGFVTGNPVTYTGSGGSAVCSQNAWELHQ
jgi:hypothetical protein